MRQKLAIRSSQKHSFSVSKFLSSYQIAENLTKEQYNNNQIVPRSLHALSVSRDTLNPLLNTAVLKERLADIEYFKYRHGVMIHRWPHFALGRLGTNLYKYKFNYGVKAFAAYIVWNDIQHYRHMKTQVFLSW